MKILITGGAGFIGFHLTRLLVKEKNEIVIVDDGCPEASGYYAKKISKKSKNIKIIFHKKNMGYGAAIRTGLKNCKHEWIFQTDGDAEYDVYDLLKLIKKTSNSDLVVTYRFKRKYKTSRIVISWIYNKILRILFHTNFRDISTGSRLIKKSLLKKIPSIPFIDIKFLINSFLTSSFLVISNDPPLDTTFPGKNFNEFGLGVISVWTNIITI